MNPLLKDLLTFIVPSAFTGYGFFMVMRERQRRAEVDDVELKKEVKNFMMEFRAYMESVKITIHEHTVMQGIATSTMSGLINKMESLERRVNTQDVLIAILNDKKG